MKPASLAFKLLTIGLLGLTSWTALQAAIPVRAAHTSAELIADVDAVAPGAEFSLGLRLTPDPHWHTYWINPGDAGKAASVDWTVPSGVEISEFQYPAPDFVPFGPMLSYGYNEPTLLIASVRLPEVLDSPLTFVGDASWVVCDDKVCIPEHAVVRLSLRVSGAESVPANRSLFAAARAKLPIATDWPSTYVVDDVQVVFEVELPPEIDSSAGLHVFPVPEKLIDHAAQQAIAVSTDRNAIRVSTAAGVRADRYAAIEYVLQVDVGDDRPQSFLLTSERADVLANSNFVEQIGSDRSTQGIHADGIAPFLQAIAFAFLGGLILNLMPCVLPILSLKALAFADLSNTEPKEARVAGYLYTAGVLVCFLLLASLLLGLRATGEHVGWAFHLQNPMVISILACLMVVVGLNFAGVYELRGTFANVGNALNRVTNARAGEFLTGTLAVILASPCTVPFMGAALGYALVQSTPVALSVFVGLGLGFAFPYLMLAVVPKLRVVLPRPGPWMETMRRLLVFPMFATALWLLWILGSQLGVDSLVVALVSVLCLAFALWAWHSSRVARSNKGVWGWRMVALPVLLFAGVAFTSIQDVAQQSGSSPSKALSSETWSTARVDALLAEQRSVFAYFTADWCITCKVNERVALQSDAVRTFFENEDIAVLVGDWTNEDSAITQELERRGRAGVPLYLYFKQGSTSSDPVILPELLTPDVVIDAIESA